MNKETEGLVVALEEEVCGVLGGDTEFDREGGYHPVADLASEIVKDKIVPILKEAGLKFVPDKWELPEYACELTVGALVETINSKIKEIEV